MKIIIIIIFIIIRLILLFKSSNIKIAICTWAKKENLYIKEYVDYYIKLGIDHIFIYDNNDDNTEKISDIFGKSYKHYITVYRNIKDSINNQSIAYTTCYNNNKDKFDFIFLNDIDEYLVIKNDTLKNYLSNEIFKDCDFIKIHLILSTDNNLLHYEEKPLFERFKGPYLNSTYIKTIVRGNIKGLQYDIHSPLSSPIRNISCNNIGKIYNFNKSNLKELYDEFNSNKAYIIHYKYKSTEEFINKLKRDYSKWFDFNFLTMKIEEYLKDNAPTLEKIEYLENELKVNLSKFKKNFLYFNDLNEKPLNILTNINNYNHNNKNKKNLVIGVLANYNWDIIEPFFVSFKRAGFNNCDCIMFVNNIQLETKKKIQSIGVLVYEVPNKLKNYKIINYRWKIYNDFLNKNKDKYNLVFTTDLTLLHSLREIFR